MIWALTVEISQISYTLDSAFGIYHGELYRNCIEQGKYYVKKAYVYKSDTKFYRS